MIRYALVLMATVAFLSAGVGFHVPRSAPAVAGISNETVIEKNSPFPVLGPLVVEECAVPDCSDVQG